MKKAFVMHKNNLIVAIAVGIAFLFTACRAGGDFTGREYMPDMAHSQAYEAYTPSRVVTADGQQVNLFADGKSAREPVKGTIPRGFMPYHFPDTPEGYDQAGLQLVNPYNGVHASIMEDAKLMYNTNCAICHGEKGDAKGYIVTNGKFPAPPPSYFEDRVLNLSEGKMFHSIHYGKNLMGSYAGQLNKDERWKVVAYIKQMQADYLSKNDSMAKNSGASADDIYNAITGVNKFYTKGMSFPKTVAATDNTMLNSNEPPVVFVDSEVDKLLTSKADLKTGDVVQLNNVFFATAKYELRNESVSELDKLVELLKGKTNLKIEIDGHTDNQGDEQANQTLSTNRAKAVYNYLIDKGIAKERLSFKGYGSSKPAANNNTEAGRAKNRRTEFRVL